MRIKKVYGESRIESCPFCEKRATTENKQDVAVCLNHKNEYLHLKCICGELLDIRKGKFGAFCTCINCGAISLNKALSMNPPVKKEKKSFVKKTASAKSIVVTSDEVDFLY